jgi:hypothetical protein
LKSSTLKLKLVRLCVVAVCSVAGNDTVYLFPEPSICARVHTLLSAHHAVPELLLTYCCADSVGIALVVWGRLFGRAVFEMGRWQCDAALLLLCTGYSRSCGDDVLHITQRGHFVSLLALVMIANTMCSRPPGLQPRHRFMGAYEQHVEPPNKDFQYLLFAAEPYETIGFKIPNLEVDKSEGKFYTDWNREKLVFTVREPPCVCRVSSVNTSPSV